jgi:hypothetical protein
MSTGMYTDCICHPIYIDFPKSSCYHCLDSANAIVSLLSKMTCSRFYVGREARSASGTNLQAYSR